MATLPRVNEDLLTSAYASLQHEKGFDRRVYETIKKDNPVLFEMIKIVLSLENKSRDFKEGYCKAAAQFYYLLQAQLECHELSDQLYFDEDDLGEEFGD
jgi:hypothetical protein